jgi:hypothetical protein
MQGYTHIRIRMNYLVKLRHFAERNNRSAPKQLQAWIDAEEKANAKQDHSDDNRTK